MEWMQANYFDGLRIRLTASPSGIRSVSFAPFPDLAEPPTTDSAVLVEAHRQLEAYFAGRLRNFDLPLDLQGTPFQLSVWRRLVDIPYGETRSYRDIAAAIGKPTAVRAVGAANGANPVAIVVPCHRVIGANGKLVGYGGGLHWKQRLLELERGGTLFG
jgi:O-6-methylguanine DNA methyltransferase